MSRVLVVLYSRSGNTEQVGSSIASLLNADLEVIKEAKERSGVFQYVKSGFEALRKKLPAILPTTHQPGFYDVVILGTPVWASHIASPLRTFLNGNIEDINRWAVFCTEGGSGHEKVFAELTELMGSQPMARMHATEKELRDGASDRKISQFTQDLEKQLTAQTPLSS